MGIRTSWIRSAACKWATFKKTCIKCCEFANSTRSHLEYTLSSLIPTSCYYASKKDICSSHFRSIRFSLYRVLNFRAVSGYFVRCFGSSQNTLLKKGIWKWAPSGCGCWCQERFWKTLEPLRRPDKTFLNLNQNTSIFRHMLVIMRSFINLFL